MKTLDEYEEDLYSLCQICGKCISEKKVVTNIASSHSKNKLHNTEYTCKCNKFHTSTGYIPAIGNCDYFTEDENKLYNFKLHK